MELNSATPVGWWKRQDLQRSARTLKQKRISTEGRDAFWCRGAEQANRYLDGWVKELETRDLLTDQEYQTLRYRQMLQAERAIFHLGPEIPDDQVPSVAMQEIDWADEKSLLGSSVLKVARRLATPGNIPELVETYFHHREDVLSTFRECAKEIGFDAESEIDRYERTLQFKVFLTALLHVDFTLDACQEPKFNKDHLLKPKSLPGAGGIYLN